MSAIPSSSSSSSSSPSQTPSSSVAIQCREGVTVATVTAKLLDEQGATLFDAAVLPTARQRGGAVVLDMAGVKYVPSLIIGGLIRLMKDLREHNQRLILASVQPTVREVFAISRVDKVLEMADSVEEAIARCHPEGGAAATAPGAGATPTPPPGMH